MELHAMGCLPVCVDISEKMIAAAKEKGLLAVRMDQEETAFKKESFDGVWSRVSLLHSPPYLMGGILNEIKDILKSNGAIFLGMKASNTHDIETEIKTTENGATYYCYWPPSMLCGIMENTGFEIKDLVIQGKDFFKERNYFDIFAVKA